MWPVITAAKEGQRVVEPKQREQRLHVAPFAVRPYHDAVAPSPRGLHFIHNRRVHRNAVRHELAVPPLRTQGDEFGKCGIPLGLVCEQRQRGLEQRAPRKHGERRRH